MNRLNYIELIIILLISSFQVSVPSENLPLTSLDHIPFERPTKNFKITASPCEIAISLGYYAISEEDYFKQSSTSTISSRIIGYISYILTQCSNRKRKLEDLFYNPDYETWKKICKVKHEETFNAVQVIELLDEAKQNVLDNIKRKPLSVYRIESYIPAFIDKTLSKIYTGCWGFSKGLVSNDVLTKLTKIFEDMAISYKSYGGAQESLVNELEASQRKHSTYSEHFEYLKTLTKKTYAGSLNIFRKVDTFAEKLFRLTVFGVAQEGNLRDFMVKEVYALLTAKITALKPHDLKESIAKLKERIAKLKEKRALKEMKTGTTTSLLKEEEVIKKDMEYFFVFLRRLNLTLSPSQTSDFLKIAEDFGDGSTKLQIWERSEPNYRVNQNILKEAIFKNNEKTLPDFSLIIYNLLKRGNIDLSKKEADKLITQLDIFNFLSEEKIRQWINLLEELYEDSLTTFEDWLSNYVIKVGSFYLNPQALCKNYISQAVLLNTSSEDNISKEKRLELNFQRCLTLIKETEKLIHNAEYLKDFRTELALRTLDNPYLSMYRACLQYYVECNQKLPKDLWEKFDILYKEEITKLKLLESLDDTVRKNLHETCPA